MYLFARIGRGSLTKIETGVLYVHLFWIKYIPKCLVTKTATKGTNVIMHSHMNNQIVRFCKSLATNFAIFENPIASFVISHCAGQILLGHRGHGSDRAGQAGTSSHIDLGFWSIVVGGGHFGDLQNFF